MKAVLSSRPGIVAVLCLAWLACVFCGLSQVEQYNHRPGPPASAPALWPTHAALHRASGSLTLLMAVHPQCPCTRASLAELARLLAHSQGRINATVVFLQYPGVSARWVQSATWRQAKAIPGVRVVADANGATARRFGALTSGQTYLYDDGGRLLFSGGLTGARGHEGDNAGLFAVLALLHGQPARCARTPVFGCPLFPRPALAEKALSSYP